MNALKQLKRKQKQSTTNVEWHTNNSDLRITEHTQMAVNNSPDTHH